MEVLLTPDTAARLNELASTSGRPANEYVQEAVANYLDELQDVRDLLSTRYEEIVSGRVTPIDGEAFFDSLLKREQSMS